MRTSSTTTVPCQKPRRIPCPISFLGEAPGEEEVDHREKDAEGKWHDNPQPFVGPSGRLFNSILRSANLDRSDFHITNVFDEKAPDNECGPWMLDRDRVAASAERLAREFGSFKPRVIVPLGGTALWALTGFTKIADFRGSVMRASRIVPGTKLLPTFHPAHVRRTWKVLPLVTGDFIRAATEAALGPKIIYPDATLLIEPNLKELRAFAKDCRGSPLMSVDIETGWGDITTIGFAPTPKLAMNVPFLDLRKPSKCYWSTPAAEVEAWQIVKELCESSIPKVMQNGLYDAIWLWLRYHIALRNYREDDRLLHHAMYPELPKSLGSMAASYTRLGAWKHWGHGGMEDKKDA